MNYKQLFSHESTQNHTNNSWNSHLEIGIIEGDGVCIPLERNAYMRSLQFPS